jgi:hypothetical protein
VIRPRHGTLTLNAGGAFTYVPAQNFSGWDSFTYRISDGADVANPAVVAINVTDVVQANQPPLAQAGGPYALDLGGSLQLDGSASSDPDAGDTIVGFDWDLNDDGAFHDASGAIPLVTAAQVSALGLAPGTHTVRLRVTDSQGATGVAITTLTIRGIPVISGLRPTTALANGPGITLTIAGSEFADTSTVSWNGSARLTTFVNPTQVTVQIPDTDLQVPGDLATGLITVRNGAGPESSPVVVTIVGPAVAVAQSVLVPNGQTGVAGEPPAVAGTAGVVAAVDNAGDPAPVTVTAARYNGNPTSVSLFEAGGGFVDLRVTGADANDAALVQFYYPSTVAGAEEQALRL